MKHAMKLLTWTISLILLTSAVICAAHGAAAAADPITELRIELAGQLTGVMGDYLKRDSTVGGQVNETISPYSTRLLSGSSPMTEADARLVYHQGLAEGTLAWIYYSQTSDTALSEAERAFLRDEVYEVQRARIAPENTAGFGVEFFTEDQDGNGSIDVEDCYTSMLSAIYSLRLNRLRDTLSSATARGILYAVIDARTTVEGLPDLESLRYENEDGANYEALYQQLRAVVELQLTVDILYPDKTVAANTGTDGADLLLQGVLKDTGIYACTTAVELNAYLKATVKALLDTLKDYDGNTPPTPLNSFHNAYLDSVAKRIMQLSADTIISPATRLTGHATELFRADCKDQLKEYAAALIAAAPHRYGEAEKNQILDRVSIYIGDGNTTAGRLDSNELTTREQLELEGRRALRGLDLFDRYLDTLARIRTHLPAQVVIPSGYGYASYDTLAALAGEQWERTAAAMDCAADTAALESLLTTASDALTQLVYRADTTRYQIDHHSLLQKQTITAADQGALSDALDAMESEVVPEAEPYLSDTLLLWCGQYKRAILDVLNALRAEDAVSTLRNEYLDALCASVNALSCPELTPEHARALRAAACRLPERAMQIDQVLTQYRTLLTAQGYAAIPQSFRNAMEQTVHTAATAVLNGTAGNSTLSDAVTELNRLDAIGRIHAAAEGSLLATVRETVNTATAQINEMTDANQMAQCAAAAIFSIEKQLLAQDMETKITALRDALRGMQYLTEDERSLLASTADELFLRGREAALSAATPAALQTANTIFETDLSTLQARSAAANLSGAKGNAKQILTDLTGTHTATVSAYRYLSREAKDTLLANLQTARDTACFALDACTDIESVRDTLLGGQQQLNARAAEAESAERAACVQQIVASLRSSYAEQNYSTEQQVTLLKLLQSYEDRLAVTVTVAEALVLQNEAQSRLAAIPNLLAEAKDSAVAQLNACYARLTLRPDATYSEENLAKLDALYEDALAAVAAFENITEASDVTQTANGACAAMERIPLDSLYTADGHLSALPVTLPEDYNPLEQGYYGAILAPSGLPAEGSLSIYGLTPGNIAALLGQAAKDRRIQNGSDTDSAISGELRKLLKNCTVSTALRIGTGVPLSGGSYTVSVLLPPEVAEEDIIGIVYRLEDGSFEFYEVTLEDSLLTFVTEHLSDYYVVSEKTANLIPWIILLCVIIACEALAVLLLTVCRAREAGKTEPALSMVAPWIGLTKYRPAFGPQLLWLLGGLALLLGVWLVRLILLRRPADRQVAEEHAAYAEDALEDEPVGAPPRPLPPLALPAPPMTAVTVKEAEELLPDTAVLACREVEYHDPEQYRGTKRAEINIDTISRHFESGETVTLNSLKEKKLVSPATGFVKILARGCLDKPLTVIAQDFSDAAMKMILLTGGTPIVTQPAPRRGAGAEPVHTRH